MTKRKNPAPVPRAGVSPVAIWVALVLLNVFVYSTVHGFQLVNWDDPGYITDNPTVLSGLSWSTAWWALTTGHSPYWHPVTWLSHLLDVSLFGLDPGAFHLVNLVLHMANTLLLFELLRRTTGALGRSAFVAAVFAVHPLHVESVAWVTERKDVLSTFFFLLTTLAYVWYARTPSPRRYLAVIALFALALMSKPMVVTLPVVLLLLDVWPLARTNERTFSALIVEKIPLFVLALATSALTVIIQHRVGAMAGLTALPWTTRVANAAIGGVSYVWKTIWPSPLAAFYPLLNVSATRVAAAVFALAAITAIAFRVRARHPYVWIGWLWYLVTIAPVIGLLQSGEQAMADRFMYVPMIGLLVAVAWTATSVISGIRTRLILGVAVAVVAVFAVVARIQVSYWSDSVTLWQHAAAVTERNYIAHENLGQAFRERGQFDTAIAEYDIALTMAPALAPNYEAVIHNSLGMVLIAQQKSADALQQFARAVALNPAFAEARTNLANTLAADGRFGEAMPHYREAIRLKPEYTEPRVGLGATLLRQGRSAEAIPEYEAALRIDPDLAQAHNGLGGALANAGRDEEAMRQYQEALRLKPDLPTAHLNVALLLIKKGDLADARRHLQTALSIDPGYEPARQALTAIGPGT